MTQLHRQHADVQVQVPTAPMGISAMNQLQASAAQAVADLGSNSVKRQQQEEAYMGQSKRYRQENDDPSEDLARQLQASSDGLPRSAAM